MQISDGRWFNPICGVEFAGFRSDTLKLQRAGWDLSIERMAMRDSIRLALRHERAKLTAITYDVNMRVIDLMRLKDRADWSDDVIFNVAHIGGPRSIHMAFSERPLFGAFDASPFASMENEKFSEYHLEDLIPFRTISEEAQEIVVDPARVSEILDKILSAQDPKQAEIREKQRRENWLREERGMEGYNARRDIKAQIIAIAG